MATWSGTTPYATKKQLVSSISGLYDDLQDFQFSTISQVSTLTASEWISTAVLYVSDIQGANIDISGITITKDGILNAPLISLSSLSFKGLDKLFDLDVSFDLGLGNALGGFFGGLGALVGGGLIGVGTGAGLAIQGAEQGIATMVASRPQNFINSNVYETINFTTQLQVSTLGNAFPLYSTITRTVSSTSANSVPGREIFVSTFFTPGTTCIRSVSDPFNLISGDSNLNTSTIQSFGQWVALPFDENTTFLALSNTTDQPLFTLDRTTESINNAPMINALQTHNFSNNFNFPYDPNALPYSTNISKMLYHRDEYFLNNTYISSPYIRFQSTLTNTAPLTYFITSSISTPAEFTWAGTSPGGNFVICQPDETGFRSTATMDFIATQSDLFIQWGLAVDNLNSTIAAGTSKRVSWDILANTSNFDPIPQAVSTIANEATQQIIDLQTNPHEIKFLTLGTAMNPSRIAFDVTGATFGSNTTLNNQSDYPYQFNSNVFVNGTLEVQNLIALSTIFAVSTTVESQLSTASVLADYIETPELYAQEGFISTLKASANWTNDYISMKSRVRMMGYATPLSLVTGRFGDIYDFTRRFDFTTDTDPQAIYIQSQPANTTLMTILSTNINIPNLTVENLTADNIVYSNADVPNLQTSTINFGWTGNFTTPTTPDFSLQQSLTTEPGLVWNNYSAASNQTLNIMAFSNTVNMLAQQFSTPLTYLNTSFGSSNIQGWASTIFYNAQTTPARVNLVSGAGRGELSLQAQTFNVVVSMNTSGGLEGLPVAVPVGSTYKFTCDGTTWTTASNAPTPGTIQYNNAFQMTMDFENLNLSTTDTLNINAEKINLNGIVAIPNAQMSNLFLNTYLSANQVYLNTDPPTDSAINILRSYTGGLNAQGTANPFNITNTINSTDFLNIKTTVNPNRGFNLFNSYNVNEWNNNSYLIDTNAGSYLPVMILGDVILKNPPFTPYTGQFFINNTLDSPSSNIPLYVNREGYLSTIGYAMANQYARVFTNDGTNWNIQSNIANPTGAGGYTFSNFYTMTMNSQATTVQVGQPLQEIMPSRIMQTNKIIMDCPQIRVYTVESPSFVSREAGFEFNTYFDSNVIFGEGQSATDSDALNPILNQYSNIYYPVAAWSPQVWISRIRTQNTIQGYDIDGVVMMVSGTLGDFIWASARYLNVALSPAGQASIRENYFMTPKNYHTGYGWIGQM
jgi:hypothetical protein